MRIRGAEADWCGRLCLYATRSSKFRQFDYVARADNSSDYCMQRVHLHVSYVPSKKKEQKMSPNLRFVTTELVELAPKLSHHM